MVNETTPKISWPENPDAYQPLDLVGTGSFAKVYKSYYKGSEVAVKIINGEQNELFSQSAFREIKILKAIKNDYVVKYLHSFLVGCSYWIITEYMDQGAIGDIMAVYYPKGLKEKIAVSIMLPVIRGIKVLHEKGVIHRDIKANNILINREGVVKISDFGTSRFLDTSKMSEGKAWSCVGTPCWLAPEVANGAESGYGNAADIWSYGITLIELAQGKPPYSHLKPIQILIKITNDPAPPFDKKNLFSKEYAELVDTILCKNPQKRPKASLIECHPTFKKSQDPEYLKNHFLNNIEDPILRHKKKTQKVTSEMQKALEEMKVHSKEFFTR